MTLEEKISTIDSPSLESIADIGVLPSGDADTIKNFFLYFFIFTCNPCDVYCGF